jgi:hypothetical protein
VAQMTGTYADSAHVAISIKRDGPQRSQSGNAAVIIMNGEPICQDHSRAIKCSSLNSTLRTTWSGLESVGQHVSDFELNFPLPVCRQIRPDSGRVPFL